MKMSISEILKLELANVIHPLIEELTNESIRISKDIFQIMKYHGILWQLSTIELWKRSKTKDYKFILWLEQPANKLQKD